MLVVNQKMGNWGLSELGPNTVDSQENLETKGMMRWIIATDELFE